MAIINIADPGGGNDINANWHTAQDSASDGDYLLFPTGTFTVNRTATTRAEATGLYTAKKLSLITNGPLATNLMWNASPSDATLSNSYYTNGGYTPMIHLDIDDDAPCGIVVEGLRLTSRSTATSTAADVGIYINKAYNFKIRNNTIEYFGHSGVRVIHKDYKAGGVIYSNAFNENAKSSTGLGLGYGVSVGGGDLYWQPRSEFGSSNFIFIETNTFNLHRHSVASGGCAKLVFRYNTDTNNGVQKNIDKVTHSVDSHAARAIGLGTTNHFSTRAIEAYNNDILHTLYFNGTTIPGSGVVASNCVGYGLICRGGSALYYNNNITGTEYAIGMYTDSTPYGTSVPIPYGPGYMGAMKYGTSKSGTTIPETEDDVWFWNNTKSSYTTAFVNIQPSYYVDGVNYHNGVTKPNYSAFTYPHPLTLE